MQADHHLILRAHPFTVETGYVPVTAGQTLQAMLLQASGGEPIRDSLRVQVGGYDVPRTLWSRVRPKPGTAIHVTGIPEGNSGTWRTVLMIVVAVAAAYVSGGGSAFTTSGGSTWFAAGSMSAAFAGAAISMVGMLAVNAMIPPPKPSTGSTGTDGQWNALTGSQNAFNPYGVIPCVIGETRFFPPHCAMPYSETLGTDSYQILMFDLGYGELEVSDIKIGDSPLSSFEGVTYEITTTPTLYTADVNETVVSVTMEDGDDATRTTAPLTERISLDILFPAGMFSIGSKGNFVASNVFFNFEYRLVGAPSWTQVTKAQSQRSALGYISNPEYTILPQFVAHPFFARRDDRKPFSSAIAWDVPAGQYEVRVTRYLSEWASGGDTEEALVGEQCTWTLLRSIRKTDPSRTGTTKLCMRIKSSEQLNGTLQTLSCLVKQKIRAWNGSGWDAPAVNINPAWVGYWLLTECPAFSVHVPESRTDIQSFVDYAPFCTANSLECRGVLDSRMVARGLIDDVLSNSLGALAMRDGKYGVLFDDGTTLPTMVFTPQDTRGFSASRIFTRLPHALKVRFKNPLANWAMDEVVVLDDGYSYRGVDARGVASVLPEPTEFETMELRMAADAIHAWRLGRMQMAQAKFRGTTYRWETDIANLVCTRGDLVHVAHDVPEWGAGSGRVLSLVAGWPVGAATLVLDEEIATVEGTSYSVQLRTATGEPLGIVACTPHSVQTGTFYLASLPAGIVAGDIAIIGNTERVTEKLLITGIYPQADLAAQLQAVAYDERVAPFWADPPASIISEITGTPQSEAPDPPVITVIVSDPRNDTPDDGGTTTPEVSVTISNPPGFIRPDERAIQ